MGGRGSRGSGLLVLCVCVCGVCGGANVLCVNVYDVAEGVRRLQSGCPDSERVATERGRGTVCLLKKEVNVPLVFQLLHLTDHLLLFIFF